MKQRILYIFLAVLSFLVTSCSSDYRTTLPAGSTALVSIDATDSEVSSRLALLTDLLKIDDAAKSGIDFRERLYLFETMDGNLGLCAKVSDDQQLRGVFKNLEKGGSAKEGPERQKCNFFIVADKWVCGYTSKALLMMGPVVSSAQGETMSTMVRMLNQDADESMLGTPMMDKLDSLTAPIGIVAQAAALPQQFSSVLTLGMPKDADDSQLVIAANVSIHNEVLHIDGQPMSFNARINKDLQASYSAFRPVTDKYIKTLDSKALMGFYANFNGTKVLPMLQQSKSLWALLAGINQAVDMNAIINSIDGDVLLSVPAYSADGMQISMAAQLSGAGFLADVDYWKKSVPKGTTLTDWQKNAYRFKGDSMSYCFGVTEGSKPELYSGSSEAQALASLQPSSSPLSPDLQKLINGKRIAFVVGISSLLPEGAGMGTLMLPQLIKLKTIVYTVK